MSTKTIRTYIINRMLNKFKLKVKKNFQNVKKNFQIEDVLGGIKTNQSHLKMENSGLNQVMSQNLS